MNSTLQLCMSIKHQEAFSLSLDSASLQQLWSQTPTVPHISESLATEMVCSFFWQKTWKHMLPEAKDLGIKYNLRGYFCSTSKNTSMTPVSCSTKVDIGHKSFQKWTFSYFCRIIPGIQVLLLIKMKISCEVKCWISVEIEEKMHAIRDTIRNTNCSGHFFKKQARKGGFFYIIRY